jgi:hypothetical protein
MQVLVAAQGIAAAQNAAMWEQHDRGAPPDYA